MKDALLQKFKRATYSGSSKEIEETLAEAKAAKITIDLEEPISGITPLFWAIMKDDKKAVKTLLKAGASIDSRDPSGRSPEAFARRQGKLEALNALRAYLTETRERVKKTQEVA